MKPIFTSTQALQCLISARAQLNLIRDGQTALQMASERGLTEAQRWGKFKEPKSFGNDKKADHSISFTSFEIDNKASLDRRIIGESGLCPAGGEDIAIIKSWAWCEEQLGVAKLMCLVLVGMRFIHKSHHFDHVQLMFYFLWFPNLHPETPRKMFPKNTMLKTLLARPQHWWNSLTSCQ